MQGLGYLHEFWDKLAIVTHESQENLDLSDIYQDWPLFNSLYLTFISGYFLGRDYAPDKQSAIEQLTLGWFELKSSLLQFQNSL